MVVAEGGTLFNCNKSVYVTKTMAQFLFEKNNFTILIVIVEILFLVINCLKTLAKYMNMQLLITELFHTFPMF